MEKNLICPVLEGRLGNLLFEIITSWAIAKKNSKEVCLDISFQNNKYYQIFFKNIKLVDISKINFVKKNVYTI
jgi:hypothetical protein